MLKKILFVYMAFVTVVLGGDLVVVLFQSKRHLPTVNLVLTTILVLFGIFLIIRQFANKLKLRELMIYYAVSSMVIIFNLLFVYLAVPVQLTIAEKLATGSVLRLILNILGLYYCVKHIRGHYTAVELDATTEKE